MTDMPVVVLISGSGSNLQALIDGAAAGTLPITIRAVVSNRADAYGLVRAANAGIPTHVVDHKAYAGNRAFCTALGACIEAHAPRLVVLAGFTRILDPGLVARFERRIINLHPSLLPAYPGLRTHRRVLENGDRVHGASVHFVVDKLDAGPVIIQGRVSVEPEDTADSLQEKVRAVEHRILPTAVHWIAGNRLTVAGDRVLLDGRLSADQGLSPEPDAIHYSNTAAT